MRYETLMEAQLAAFPDTRVLTDDEMADMMYHAYPDWLKDVTLTNWDKSDWYANDIDRKQALFEYKELELTRARLSWARGAFMNRAQDPQGFFYACHKQPDGTYRHVGFRFGKSDHEYASGFHGLTFKPQGETK
jgi:hypothetical protein